MQAQQPQVYKVCPRNRTKLAPTDKAVAITFNLLKPYFNKPLVEASEELGLSATAIKDQEGVPQVWDPEVALPHADLQGQPQPPPSASDTDQSSSDAEEAGVSSCEDDEEQAQQQPATRPVADEEECCSPLSVEDDGFAEFVNPSVSESAKGEFEQTMWAPAPLQIYTLEEAKESDLKSPKMRVSEDAYMSFLGSAFEEPTLESFDTELFDWNIGM
eukprot:3104492-Rhodomonas_salina.2